MADCPIRSHKDKKKDLVEEWVACDGCDSWVIPNKDWLSTRNKKVKFLCKSCITIDNLLSKFASLNSEITSLKKALETSKVAKENRDLEILDEIENKVKKSWSDIVVSTPSCTSNSAASASLSAPQLTQAANELQDREKRKMNLIVSGLPERNNDALEFVNFANEDCKLPHPIAQSDIEVERLGLPSGRTRLLRVKLSSIKIRRSLLIMRRTPKAAGTDEAQPDNIYIRPDLTKLQQESDRNLRKELLERGKDKYKIFRGVLVPRDHLCKDAERGVLDQAIAAQPTNTNTTTPEWNIVGSKGKPIKAKSQETKGLTTNQQKEQINESSSVVSRTATVGKTSTTDNGSEDKLTPSAFGMAADMAANKSREKKESKKGGAKSHVEPPSTVHIQLDDVPKGDPMNQDQTNELLLPQVAVLQKVSKEEKAEVILASKGSPSSSTMGAAVINLSMTSDATKSSPLTEKKSSSLIVKKSTGMRAYRSIADQVSITNKSSTPVAKIGSRKASPKVTPNGLVSGSLPKPGIITRAKENAVKSANQQAIKPTSKKSQNSSSLGPANSI